MTRMARMTRMAHTVARMARWLADLADPLINVFTTLLECFFITLFVLLDNITDMKLQLPKK